jgi:hypothetical protein
MAQAKKSRTPKSAPRHGLVLTADQADTLAEMCTLAFYSDGFTFTNGPRIGRAVAFGRQRQTDVAGVSEE